MANSLYNQLNRNSSSQSNLATFLKSIQNPQQMLMDMAMKDSRVANLMNEVSQSGDPKALFYRKAKEMGVDPESILRQLK